MCLRGGKAVELWQHCLTQHQYTCVWENQGNLGSLSPSGLLKVGAHIQPWERDSVNHTGPYSLP